LAPQQKSCACTEKLLTTGSTRVEASRINAEALSCRPTAKTKSPLPKKALLRTKYHLPLTPTIQNSLRYLNTVPNDALDERAIQTCSRRHFLIYSVSNHSK